MKTQDYWKPYYSAVSLTFNDGTENQLQKGRCIKMEQNKLQVVVIFLLIFVFVLIEVSVGQSEKEFPVNLLFSSNDVARIRENTELPIFKDFWQTLLQSDASKDKNFSQNCILSNCLQNLSAYQIYGRKFLVLIVKLSRIAGKSVIR